MLNLSKSYLDQKLLHNISQKRFFPMPENASSQGYFAEVSFETLEENQLSYVQNGYFDRIL